MAVEKATSQGVGRRLLRCHVCTRTEERTATEMLGYCQSTWPRCCGEVMAYFTETDPEYRDGADDTTPNIRLPQTA
ncbi:MAG TPA: hypothetical protein VM597_30920 [Gemmataceae bacterium]|jgi:hypothetical protein|nr:hypothetical protein [Gemmataceae bacterium]